MSVKKYLPEIVTGIAIGTHIASNILFIKADRLYLKDHKKSHFALPVIFSAGSIVSILLSNRLSSKQKASILAASSAFLTESLLERRKNDNDISNISLEDLMIAADRVNQNALDPPDGVNELIYLPDYGIIFWKDISEVMRAELNLNEFFQSQGIAYLSDFFNFLEFNAKDSPELYEIAEHYGWRINWYDYDSGLQYITFNNFERVIRFKGKDIVCHFVYFNEEPLPMHEWTRIYGDEE